MAPQWLRAIGSFVPHGSKLPERAWVFRHRMIVGFALVLSLAVTVFAVSQGTDPGPALLEGAAPALLSAAALKAPCGRRLRASLTAVALMITAVMVVHTSGTIEAHFLFFIMVPIVALYEDWTPLAAAALVVFSHHWVLGLLAPQHIYNHPAALADPLMWAIIHTLLFLAICATSIVHWTIHERARAEEEMLLNRLASQALHDPLTGLANRTLLQERLRAAFAAGVQHGEPLLVLSLDIDGFKPVNDSYGHAAGDALLLELARRIQSCTRSGDTAARTGGDEFTLLLPGSGADMAAGMARRIMDAVAEPVEVAGKVLHMTASVGVAVRCGIAAGSEAESESENIDNLLEWADQAMYAAKRAGRGRFVIHDQFRPTDTDSTLPVQPDQARAWAAYTRTLRQEIAAAKGLGRLPQQTRGPETARRTLESMLAAIDQLPAGPEPAGMLLPERTALQEFVFHHELVQQWTDSLTQQEVLNVPRPADATAFWDELRQTVSDPVDR
ncbi:GGDEF domain-containing protein [Micrococcaceae bacterium Sec5.8]